MAMTTLAPEDVAQIWQEFKQDPDNQELRNRLVEMYLPLVKYNGERIWSRLPEGVELDDLISAGVFGLMDAIDAFDLSRGVKFETYCVPRIRGAMLDELRTMDWVPRLVRSKASKLNEAVKTLEARLGRSPTEIELAEQMGISVPELEKMMLDANAVNLISLNKKWYETDSYKDVREIDILEDKKGEDPTRRIQKNDLMRLVTKGLNRNERLIIILYYYEELTMKEIGATLDLSRKPRQPDAQLDRAAAAKPASAPPAGVRNLIRTHAAGCVSAETDRRSNPPEAPVGPSSVVRWARLGGWFLTEVTFDLSIVALRPVCRAELRRVRSLAWPGASACGIRWQLGGRRLPCPGPRQSPRACQTPQPCSPCVRRTNAARSSPGACTIGPTVPTRRCTSRCWCCTCKGPY